MELDPQVSPEKTMSREVELDCESWTSFASGCSSTAVQRTLSLPSTAVETAIAQCTPGRGDTALTLPLFWRRSTVSPVFSRAVSAVEPSLSCPLPTLSPSLIRQLASVDVKQHENCFNLSIVQELYEVDVLGCPS